MGEARLLRLRTPSSPGACPAPKVLFEIPSRRWTTSKPRGASYASTGEISVREADRRFKGREVVLRQPWYRRDDAGCCPTWVATAVFRFEAKRDRYVKARERVRRLPEPR